MKIVRHGMGEEVRFSSVKRGQVFQLVDHEFYEDEQRHPWAILLTDKGPVDLGDGYSVHVKDDEPVYVLDVELHIKESK